MMPMPPPQGAPPPQNQPPQSGGPPAGLSGLVQGGPSATPQGPTAQEKTQAYYEQVRNLHMAIDALAQQHPEAANDLNDAKNALNQSMGKVATAMASPEGQPQPQTF